MEFSDKVNIQDVFFPPLYHKTAFSNGEKSWIEHHLWLKCIRLTTKAPHFVENLYYQQRPLWVSKSASARPGLTSELLILYCMNKISVKEKIGIRNNSSCVINTLANHWKANWRERKRRGNVLHRPIREPSLLNGRKYLMARGCRS